MTHGRSLLHSESPPAAPPARPGTGHRPPRSRDPAAPAPRPAANFLYCRRTGRAVGAAGSQIRPGGTALPRPGRPGGRGPRVAGAARAAEAGEWARGARGWQAGEAARAAVCGVRGARALSGASGAQRAHPPLQWAVRGIPERSALGREVGGPSTLRVGGPLGLLQVGVCATGAASGEGQEANSD